jgi:hypothetical protein
MKNSPGYPGGSTFSRISRRLTRLGRTDRTTSGFRIKLCTAQKLRKSTIKWFYHMQACGDATDNNAVLPQAINNKEYRKDYHRDPSF